MSKPATTYFCGKGHLLQDNPEGCVGEYDFLEDGEYPPCQYCQSVIVVSVLGWHEGCSTIPYLSIDKEDFECTDHRGNTYYQLINIYDVSAKL